MKFLHSFLVAVLLACLAVSAAHVDRWRSLILFAALVCVVVGRDDLTEKP